MEKDKIPGYLFLEKPDSYSATHMETAALGDKNFDQYLRERVAHYTDHDSIPEHGVFSYIVDDLKELPPREDLSAEEYYNQYSSNIASTCKKIDEGANLIEAAYCIENGIDRGSFKGSNLGLYLSQQFRLYRSVNQNGFRLRFTEYTDEYKDSLLKYLNSIRPEAHITHLPAIGKVPAYAPEWAEKKYGMKDNLKDVDTALQKASKRKKL